MRCRSTIRRKSQRGNWTTASPRMRAVARTRAPVSMHVDPSCAKLFMNRTTNICLVVYIRTSYKKLVTQIRCLPVLFMNNFAQLGSPCIETGARVRATALIRGEAVVQLPRCDFLRMVLRHLMAYRPGNEASDWIFFCCASYACQD